MAEDSYIGMLEKLHDLIEIGKGQSVAANGIRDRMTEKWDRMGEGKRTRARRRMTDLVRERRARRSPKPSRVYE